MVYSNRTRCINDVYEDLAEGKYGGSLHSNMYIYGRNRGLGRFGKVIYLILFDIGPSTPVDTDSPRCGLGIPANRGPTPKESHDLPDRAVN